MNDRQRDYSMPRGSAHRGIMKRGWLSSMYHTNTIQTYYRYAAGYAVNKFGDFAVTKIIKT